jgi:bifunctional enzyme CysN/CysC
MTFTNYNNIKEQMNVVVVGHVDHGKSTIIGRLLVDTNALPKGKLETVQENCRKNGQTFEYAFLIDALKDEQAQSITIDSARIFFQSKNRNYIIIDAPGHIEFIKNMVTGASHAEAAILVIDAFEGVQENSRRHGYLLWMLGIKKVIVLVNKMDLVDYKQEAFDKVVTEYQKYLNAIGVQPEHYIPVSGREGDGVVENSKNMPWFVGLTVLDALDAFKKEKPISDLPLRLPIQDIYKFSSTGDKRRIIVGNISSGNLNLNDELVIFPSGKRTSVKTIESFNTEKITSAQAGESIGFTMTEQIYINRGQIISRASDSPPNISTRLRVSLFWLGRKPLSQNQDYIIKLGTAREKVRVEQIHHIIDTSDFGSQIGKSEILHHDVAEITLKLSHPMAFDTSEKIPETSRFVIVDEYEIRGGGIVLEALPDDKSSLRQEVFTRNEKWVQSLVNMDLRADKYNQRSSIIIITGKKGVGRKTLARKLEEQLFESGKLVYYLGIGSLLYGVNADLKRNDEKGNWQEHIRRFAEVSHLFLDAGILLILTAIEFTDADLDIIKTILEPDKVHVVWVGEKVTTDISFDIHIHDREKIGDSVEKIKHLLQEKGIIFKP